VRPGFAYRSRVTPDDLRIADLVTFLAVRRSGSITGAARTLRVTPSQVSKAVTRLESQLGVRLLARGARGISLSAAAARIAPQLEDIVRRVSTLHTAETAGELTVAAPSFLNVLFLPALARSVPSFRVRGIELPPALVRAYAAENIFDVALTLGLERFPDTWETSRIGDIRKALFATPAIARRLGRQPVAPEKLRELPFVVPIYSHNGQFVVADEGCPIQGNRRIGHEVPTMTLGLELAAATDHLVFGPTAVAAPYVERGALVEVAVKGWNVREELSFACNADRILKRHRDGFLVAMRARLAELAR
jgi:LysR family glycine cleavage system transcriptional activator